MTHSTLRFACLALVACATVAHAQGLEEIERVSLEAYDLDRGVTAVEFDAYGAPRLTYNLGEQSWTLPARWISPDERRLLRNQVWDLAPPPRDSPERKADSGLVLRVSDGTRTLAWSVEYEEQLPPSLLPLGRGLLQVLSRAPRLEERTLEADVVFGRLVAGNRSLRAESPLGELLETLEGERVLVQVLVVDGVPTAPLYLLGFDGDQSVVPVQGLGEQPDSLRSMADGVEPWNLMVPVMPSLSRDRPRGDVTLSWSAERAAALLSRQAAATSSETAPGGGIAGALAGPE